MDNNNNHDGWINGFIFDNQDSNNHVHNNLLHNHLVSQYSASNNDAYQINIHQYYSSSDFVRKNNPIHRIPGNNGLPNHAPNDAMRTTHQNSARNN
ncbi:6764_t:CDS:1, partial [Entrophospora sp. SA101]